MRPFRSGMTLIELVVALALAAMMMSAVVGLVSLLARDQQTLAARFPSESWKLRLSEQLRWDLVNATQLRAWPDRLTLVGYGGRSFETGLPTQRPTQIDYFLTQDGHRVWLARREMHLDDLTNQNHRTDLVCEGVLEIVIERLDDESDQATARANARRRREQRLGPVPTRLRLSFYPSTDEADAPLFEQDFFLR